MSASFLKQTRRLIDRIRDSDPEYMVLKHQSQWINHPSKDVPLHHLPDQIGTLEEFYYFISHHPFSVDILNNLNTFVQQDPSIPEFDRRYLFSPFLSPMIQGWIFEHCPYLTTFQLQTSTGLIINLDILSETSGDFAPVLKSIANVITMVRHAYQVKDQVHRPIHIIYAMTPFHKRLNIFTKNIKINRSLRKETSLRSLRYNYTTFTNPITNLNVNSGLTDHGSGGENGGDGDVYIMIWRTEEFEKVLIHELIHYYDLEKTYELPIIPVNISNNYSHHSRELTTELQTWYLYIIYRLTIDPSLDVVNVLEQERMYSLIVMARILRHFQIRDLNQFLGDDPKYMLNLGSSTLYYYIFKAVVLFHPYEELLHPSKPCRRCKRVLTDHLTQTIQQTLVDPTFREAINRLLSVVTPLDDDMRMMSGDYV